MNVYKVKNYEEMSRKAANIIAAQVLLKPSSVLGLATGSTPEGTYTELIERFNQGDIDFKEVKSVNLDEYKNLASNDEQSYNFYMNKHLFSKINMQPENTHLPNGMAENDAVECARYDALIKNLGSVDLQILGLGPNGHIGFNEPDEYFTKGTQCVGLAESTIQANSRLFNNIKEVPKYAFSMGIQTIMSAKKIVLMASGTAKAQAVRDMLLGNITPKVPASILQLHPDVTIIADEEAFSLTDI